MTHMEVAAYVIAQAALLNCRIAGMVAENMQRQHRGESMAFVEADFARVEAEASNCLGHNAVVQMCQDARD